MNWGVINWGIPLEEFADTYNGQPLCYVALGSHKSYNSLYLMGAYNSSNGKYTSPFSEKLLVDAFKKAGKRLDMGTCCLHFELHEEIEDALELVLGDPASRVFHVQPNAIGVHVRGETDHAAR